MLTVSKLADSCGLSRSTVLYYESIGLLRASSRSGANYRRYSDADAARLRQICVYRDAGLKLDDIRVLLDRPGSDPSSLLERRLVEINDEIERLRDHQRAILKLLRTNDSLWREKDMTKDKWVAIMKAAGFNEDDMRRWHQQFEKAEPAEHQQFLEYLHIPAADITKIREWSRTA
ncbi:MAG: MerR family transcriptional regulator [Acidobacteria bacterium]|nr:MerR family transcriptional regulator [Acidobacteriota bacterium]